MACCKGWIDIHAHILPGVDDGARDWNEADRLLSLSYDQGVRHIIATPHFKIDQDTKLLRHLSMELELRANAISENYHISLGQEIMYFESVLDYLDSGKALTLAGSRYVLVEFEPSASFHKIKRAVRQLVQASYLPVIAHVERCVSLVQDERAGELAGYGAYLQMNAGSLAGGWLDRRSRWCRKSLQKGLIHFLASDMHNMQNRAPNLNGAVSWIERHAGEETADQTARSNPGFVLADQILQ